MIATQSGFYFVTLSRLRLIAVASVIGGIKKKNLLETSVTLLILTVLVITSRSLQGNYGCTGRTMKGPLTMLCVYHRTHSYKEVFHSVFCKQTESPEDQRTAWSFLSGPNYSHCGGRAANAGRVKHERGMWQRVRSWSQIKFANKTHKRKQTIKSPLALLFFFFLLPHEK